MWKNWHVLLVSCKVCFFSEVTVFFSTLTKSFLDFSATFYQWRASPLHLLYLGFHAWERKLFSCSGIESFSPVFKTGVTIRLSSKQCRAAVKMLLNLIIKKQKSCMILLEIGVNSSLNINKTEVLENPNLLILFFLNQNIPLLLY